MRASSENPLWQFKLKDQPANSPDCNILDLGFFRALQSLQFQREPATTIDGLIANVEAAWEDYDPVSINSVFLTHQSCMNKIIETMGGNGYKIPHIGKKAPNNAGCCRRNLTSATRRTACWRSSLVMHYRSQYTCIQMLYVSVEHIYSSVELLLPRHARVMPAKTCCLWS